MAYMKKLPEGTISASGYLDCAVTVGFYDHESFLSVEHRDGRLYLLLNDAVLARDGVEVAHVNENWEIFDKEGE